MKNTKKSTLERTAGTGKILEIGRKKIVSTLRLPTNIVDGDMPPPAGNSGTCTCATRCATC